MITKKNVLIFGGGAYNAQEVYFALRGTVRYNPILASSNDNHSIFIDSNAITDLPYDNDSCFIDQLNKVIRERSIDYIIPTHDTNAMILMENESRINATIVCSPYETTKICRYKSLTYKTLKDTSFVPKTYSRNSSEIEFPIFAKDDKGQGGRNAFIINNYEELFKLDQSVEYVLCEYLPGEEITIDCFTDRNGDIKFIQPRIRARILNGISSRAVAIDITDEISNIVKQINTRIKFRGYWYIQCRKDINGKYKLLEISTRFAGTFNLSKNLDANLPLLALADFSGMDINILPNKQKVILDKSYIDRYFLEYEYKRVYIDFDDTLVFNRETYNTEAMRFLYQCLNKKIELILITKHAYDIYETARNIKLGLNIFNKIIEVPNNVPKYKYIDNTVPSIFIDNAFAERMAVKKELGIPTFDVTNFECLIDWRMI